MNVLGVRRCVSKNGTHAYTYPFLADQLNGKHVRLPNQLLTTWAWQLILMEMSSSHCVATKAEDTRKAEQGWQASLGSMLSPEEKRQRHLLCSCRQLVKIMSWWIRSPTTMKPVSRSESRNEITIGTRRMLWRRKIIELDKERLRLQLQEDRMFSLQEQTLLFETGGFHND